MAEARPQDGVERQSAVYSSGNEGNGTHHDSVAVM